MSQRILQWLTWTALLAVVGVSLFAAATSPLLAWREPVYIAAGLAGVAALSLLLFQPLLAGGFLPGLPALLRWQLHRWVGLLTLGAIIIHVLGLWITSPPDIIDALLFVSPTPFAFWGVIAMWCLIATACLAMFRRKLRLNARTWRLIHKTLAVVIVIGSVAHAMLIDGTMETISKSLLCLLVVAATAALLLPARSGSANTKSR